MDGCQSYKAAIQRLKTLRKMKKYSQEEMGKLLGVTQSYYQRLEKGYNIVSENSLRKMLNEGEDVFGIITGKWNETNALNAYVYRYEDLHKTKRLLQVMTAYINEGICISRLEQEKSLSKSYKLLQICELDEEFIWKKIRNDENLTQKQMAELLGIDVKKYRRLEKGTIDTDMELLVVLYEKLQYSPMLILDYRRAFSYEMNYIFSKFDSKLQKKMCTCLDMYVELMDSQ